MPQREPISSVRQLEEMLSSPSPQLKEAVSKLSGDFLVLGTGGKMGPSMVSLLLNSTRGLGRRIIATSRFSDSNSAERLEGLGAEVIRKDLLERGALDELPDAENVIDMLGQKFGTTGSEARTWAVNGYLAGRVMERFPTSRIVFFSTGNVYPLTSVQDAGAREDCAPGPVGEYAQSRLAGERIVEYFSRKNQTRVAIMRLNYAVELGYGVIHDIARSIVAARPIDLSNGYVNVIWQRDANEMAIRLLSAASVPPAVFNVTGGEVLSVRDLALRLGALIGVPPRFVGTEKTTALLSDAAAVHRLLGIHDLPIEDVLFWVAEWVRSGGKSLELPTHFEEREGRF